MSRRPRKSQRNFREEILVFVSAFIFQNGYPPTYDEIKDSIGLSSRSHVDYYLDDLEATGLIERRPRTPRGLRLVNVPSRSIEVKIEGGIAAGKAVMPFEGPNRRLEITLDLADSQAELYALQVQGDSMTDEMVSDGDLVIVERRGAVSRGEMALVDLNDRSEAMLRRVYPQGDRVRLQPAHPLTAPMYTSAQNVTIKGRVVTIIRWP